jgi:hypothetical protein
MEIILLFLDLTLYKIGKTINSKSRFYKHNSPLANDLEVLFQYKTDNIDQVKSCIKYRKYVLIKILFMKKINDNEILYLLILNFFNYKLFNI